MAPFWHPKSTKIHAKIDSKRHPKNDRFLDRFFAQVGSILGPKLGPKSRSRRSQNAPQDIPKTPPRQPKSHKSIQDRNLVHFWSQSPMEYAPLALIFRNCCHIHVLLLPQILSTAASLRQPWLLLDYLRTSLYGSISFTGFPIICDCS